MITPASGISHDGIRRPRVAYIMSRFPKLTETFVLYELLAVERIGVSVEVYPLRREQTNVMHPEARNVVQRAHFTPWFSLAILVAHLRFALRQPRTYFGLIVTLFRANLGSRRYLTGAAMFFPKAVFLAQCMQRDKIDHIHAHFASHPAVVAFVIHRLTGIPFSFTAHGSDLHRDRHMLREKVADASFVATISEYNRHVINDECTGMDVSHVHVIHCGADTELFHPGSNERDPHDVIRIFCVGTLHEVKGQTELLQAVRILTDRQTRCTVHFIGDGPDMQRLRRQARELGIDQLTTFHGRKNRHEVANLLRTADIVASPSVPTSNGRKEGIPVALMEAMASGVAVVASRLSGIPELVTDGQNGLLTNPRDVEQLAAAIERLVVDPDLRRTIAAEGRHTVIADFDLNSNARKLVDLFCRSTTGIENHCRAGHSPTYKPTAVGDMTPCA